jgi:hypothetical protein
MSTEPPIEQTLREIHRVFCEVTGQQPPFATCQRRLFEFHNTGFSTDELRLVLAYARQANRNFSGGIGYSLSFGSLVGNLEKFGDLLGLARAEKRAKDYKARHSYPPAKAEVLRATGRPDAPVVPEGCMSAKEALKQMREGL